jgi:hypothetical protein
MRCHAVGSAALASRWEGPWAAWGGGLPHSRPCARSATIFARSQPAQKSGAPAGRRCRRGRQRLPAHLLQGGRDLVTSPSSGLALLSLPPLPLSLSATKFSRPAAQHPLWESGWAGLRRRRQKAEQADRGLVPSLSSGLVLLSALSPSQLVVGHQIFSACGAAPPAALGWPAAQKAGSRKQTGDYPLLQGGGG